MIDGKYNPYPISTYKLVRIVISRLHDKMILRPPDSGQHFSPVIYTKPQPYNCWSNTIMLRLAADRNSRMHISQPNKAMQIPVSVELAPALSARYSRSLKASVKVQCIGNAENLRLTVAGVDASHRVFYYPEVKRKHCPAAF